jgi:hypothetical protein
VSKLQARARGILQRKLYERSIQASKEAIRAQIEQNQPREEEPTAAGAEIGECFGEIQRLEQELALIERQHLVELEQIECRKAQEMKRIREEAEKEVEHLPPVSSRLSAEVKSNHRLIRALRRERQRILEENESLRNDLVDIREEQRLLLTESVQLQDRAKSVQQYIDTATKRNDDWSKASMQYEVHVAHVQSMIDEREARTAMEEGLKHLYGRTVSDLAQLLGGQQVVFDRQEIQRQVDSIDSTSTLLYAA